MADHGRNADGATGGIATGDKGAAGATSADQAAEPNVVPFPGDWIGPLDELVPINLEPPEQDSPDASSFWDGDPTAVHEAIGSDAPKAGSARQRVGSTYRATQSQPSGSGVSSWPRQRRRGPASLLTGGMVFAVLIACLAVVLVLRGGLLHGASKPATGLAKSKTVATKPATTHARSATAKRKPVSVRKREPLRTTTKPKPRPKQKRKPVTITRHVTVTAQAPVTYTPPPQTVVEVTRPPAPVQHVVAAPPKSHATSHVTHTTSCVMSPDSGCLP
jgi:hypothetical protein